MVVHPTSASTWQSFRETFNQHLSETLARDIASLPLSQDASLAAVFNHLKNLAEHGKRVRPYVAALAFEAAGGELTTQPWEAWVGIELIHLFALIHDDVIDQGKMRHTVETVQTFVQRRLQEQERSGNHVRIADSEALLAGDMVYTWALKHLIGALQTNKKHVQAMQILFELMQEVIAGQTLDVDLTTRRAEPYALIEQKMLLKTARYTFTRPLQLGAVLSGTATEAFLQFCQDFGDQLGLAFQLQDDWFDLIATEQRTGKSGCRDLEEAQQTFFTCFVYKEGTLPQQERLSRLLGYPLNKDQQEEAYALFTEVGAIKNGERLIEKYFQEAERILTQATFLSETSRLAFQSFVSTLKTRSA